MLRLTRERVVSPSKIRRRKIQNPFLFSVCFLVLVTVIGITGTHLVFASARSTPFTPGQTIDPGTDSQPCGPLDANCFPSVSSSIDSYLSASSTVPKTYTANIFSALQTFGNNISFGGATLNVSSLLSGNFLKYNGTNWINSAITTSDVSGLGSLATANSINNANWSGAQLTVSNGGTGATSLGQGWLYSDGSGSALTSSTSPTVASITATNTTATSTFAGGLSVAGSSGLTVLRNGMVGIGTTTPNMKLSLWGAGTSGFFGISSTTQGDIFTVDPTGKVGMGISTPLTPLHVSTNNIANISTWPGSRFNIASGDVLYLQSPSGSGVTSIFLKSVNATTSSSYSARIGLVDPPITGSGQLGDLAFATSNFGTGIQAEIMRLTSGGSLLMGTTTVDANSKAKIDIVRNSTTDGANIRFKSNFSTAGYGVNYVLTNDLNTTLQMNNENSGAYNDGSFMGFAMANSQKLISTGASALGIYTTNTAPMYIGTNNIARIGISGTSGFVGIGTTSPMSKLSIFQSANTVAGGISLSSLASSTRSIFMDDSNILHFSGNGNDATLNAAGAWTNASDIAYKENVVNLSTKYGLDTVLATSPRFYDMKGSHIPQVGFIAQELKPIIPEVVEGQDGSMGISYGNLVAVAFQAIKDLNAKIDSLIKNGIATIKDLVVDTLTAKKVTTDTVETNTAIIQTASISNGIEMKDKKTGQMYCITMSDGQFDKQTGSCAVATSTQPVATTTQPIVTQALPIASLTPPIDPVASSTPVIDSVATSTDIQATSTASSTLVTSPEATSSSTPVITPPDTSTSSSTPNQIPPDESPPPTVASTSPVTTETVLHPIQTPAPTSEATTTPNL